MLPNLDYERRLQALERFMREIRGDRGAIEPTVWTPTWTGLTITGAPTYTGRYTRTGRLIFCEVFITANGGTTASTLNTTYINNLPFANNANTMPTVDAVNNGTGANLGKGYVAGSALTRAFTPTWAASGNDIAISFWYTT